jgi:hypothetical protein
MRVISAASVFATAIGMSCYLDRPDLGVTYDLTGMVLNQPILVRTRR